jgi:hypothetical protein
MNIHLYIFITILNVLVSIFILALYLYFKKNNPERFSKDKKRYKTNISRSILLIFITTSISYNFNLPGSLLTLIVIKSILLVVIAYRLKNLIAI